MLLASRLAHRLHRRKWWQVIFFSSIFMLRKLWSTNTLWIGRVLVSDTCRVRQRQDTDTCNYIELCDFFKLLVVSVCQCPCRVQCPRPYPCFIVPKQYTDIPLTHVSSLLILYWWHYFFFSFRILPHNYVHCIFWIFCFTSLLLSQHLKPNYLSYCYLCKIITRDHVCSAKVIFNWYLYQQTNFLFQIFSIKSSSSTHC